MTRRSRRTLPAVLTALVLLTVGALVAVSTIQLLLGRSPLVPLADIAATLSALPWNSGTVIAAAIAIGVIGLVLLAGGVWPGRTHVFPLHPATGPGHTLAEAGLHRSALSRIVRARAVEIDGVSRVRDQPPPTGHRHRHDGLLHRPRPTRAAVRDALATRLGELDLVRVPRLRVRITTRKETT